MQNSPMYIRVGTSQFPSAEVLFERETEANCFKRLLTVTVFVGNQSQIRSVHRRSGSRVSCESVWPTLINRFHFLFVYCSVIRKLFISQTPSHFDETIIKHAESVSIMLVNRKTPSVFEKKKQHFW